MKSAILYFAIILVICSCNSTYDDEITTIPDNGITLNKWHITGPFPSNGTENFLDVDNLKNWNLSEKNFREDDFNKIDTAVIPANIKLLPNFVNKLYESSEDVVDLNKVFGYVQMEQSISGNAYLGCTIRSNKRRKLYLNFTSDDNSKVWINGKEILRLEKSEAVIAYEKYVPVKLKRGNNFILVKVNNGMFDWQMYAKLEEKSEEGLKRNQILLSRLVNHTFLNKSILDTSFIIATSNRLPIEKYEITLTDQSGMITEKYKIKNPKTWEVDLENLKEGLYIAKMKLNSDTLTQFIYKGDLIATTKKIISGFDFTNINDQNYIASVNANIYRFNHLLKPGNNGSNVVEKLAWQRKLIYIYNDLYELFKKAHTDKPLNGMPGIHLRSYISRIDSAPQYYIIHVPETYTEKDTFPVVTFMPAKLPNHQYYLESMRVADLKLIENLQDMSNKYRMIVLEPFFREVGKPNFNSIGEDDFFEVYESVKKLYNIDTSRVYLTGTCAGGFKVLRMAVQYPDMYTAIGVVSPEFNEKFSKNPWLTDNQPMNFVKNISNIPMLIIHSSKDKHTSVINSDFFMEIAEKYKMKNITYKRLENVIDLYYWYSFSDDIFEFFASKKDHTIPNQINFSTCRLKYNNAYWIRDIQYNSNSNATITASINDNNEINITTTNNVYSYIINIDNSPVKKDEKLKIVENGKLIFESKVNAGNYFSGTSDYKNKLHKKPTIAGPFTQIFTDRFIIVTGSSGNKAENKKLSEIADSIQSYWLFKYQNKCIVKYDYEITTDDISSSSLLLLGNNESNNIFKEIYKRLPLKISPGMIKIKNKEINGNALGFYMIYPNPLNPSKYVGIIGYNNSNYISFGQSDMAPEEYNALIAYLKNEIYFEISTYGWYDYKVWNGNKEVLEKGNFDYFWNN